MSKAPIYTQRIQTAHSGFEPGTFDCDSNPLLPLRPPPPPQLESVADCASRLRVLSQALDVSELRLDGGAPLRRCELTRLQGASLGLDTKESLLEAWGLVLLANNQLEAQNTGTELRAR